MKAAEQRARLILIAILLSIAGCENQAVGTSDTSNRQIQVDNLFSHDGCTIYRFHDGGYLHYYAKCDNSAEVTNRYSCGKSCTIEDSIRTDR